MLLAAGESPSEVGASMLWLLWGEEPVPDRPVVGALVHVVERQRSGETMLSDPRPLNTQTDSRRELSDGVWSMKDILARPIRKALEETSPRPDPTS